MIYKTHILFAETVALSPYILEKFGIIESNVNIWNNYPLAEIWVFLLILAVSALLPDLDEEEAWLSKKIPIISFFTGQLQHRGLTHYFITPIILAIIFYFTISVENIIIGYLIVTGWVLHIVGDAMTKSGIPNAFFPFKLNFYLFPKPFRFRTYGVTERFVILPGLFVIFLYEIYLVLSFSKVIF